MSTMPATHGHNEACCNIPPVIAKDYEHKGSYEQIGGKKTCKNVHMPQLAHEAHHKAWCADMTPVDAKT